MGNYLLNNKIYLMKFIALTIIAVVKAQDAPTAKAVGTGCKVGGTDFCGPTDTIAAVLLPTVWSWMLLPHQLLQRPQLLTLLCATRSQLVMTSPDQLERLEMIPFQPCGQELTSNAYQVQKLSSLLPPLQ